MFASLTKTSADSLAETGRPRKLNSLRAKQVKIGVHGLLRERGPGSNPDPQLGFLRAKGLHIINQKLSSPHEDERPPLEQFNPRAYQGAPSLPCQPPRRQVNTSEENITHS